MDAYLHLVRVFCVILVSSYRQIFTIIRMKLIFVKGLGSPKIDLVDCKIAQIMTMKQLYSANIIFDAQ